MCDGYFLIFYFTTFATFFNFRYRENFDSFPETSNKTRKLKEEIRKELEDSIIGGDRNNNKEPEEKADKDKKGAAAVIREFEEIIKSKKGNIPWLAHQQGIVFEILKENAKFIEMVKQFGVSKSTIILKINIANLINKRPKIKNSSLSLKFMKIYFKMIRKIREENASEFE